MHASEKAGGINEAYIQVRCGGRHEPVHEDVAVAGEALPAEGAGVHGVAAGLAATVEKLDDKERRGGGSHHFSVLELSLSWGTNTTTLPH